jgi:hypothetical protein
LPCKQDVVGSTYSERATISIFYSQRFASLTGSSNLLDGLVLRRWILAAFRSRRVPGQVPELLRKRPGLLGLGSGWMADLCLILRGEVVANRGDLAALEADELGRLRKPLALRAAA